MQHHWKERTSSNPDVLAGKPVIVGTRISVELILDRLASGWSINEVIEAYPNIAPADVLAALAFSADVMRRKLYITVTEVEESAGSE